MNTMQALYDSEINCDLSTFWDDGFTWTLGDKLNGWAAQGTAPSWEEAEKELSEAACRHYPESDFAKALARVKTSIQHSPNCPYKDDPDDVEPPLAGHDGHVCKGCGGTRSRAKYPGAPGPPYCCALGCPNDAEFEVVQEHADIPPYEGATHACMEHVGTMLGSPADGPDVPSWTVLPLPPYEDQTPKDFPDGGPA